MPQSEPKEEKKQIAKQSNVQSNMQETLRPICFGQQGYDFIKNENGIYVDKTKIIYELLTQKANYVFIARPRRFGKSLLLSTIKEMYTQKNPANYFKDAWFGKQNKSVWEKIGQYPVIMIEMPFCPDSIEVLKSSLKKAVYTATGYSGPELDSPETALEYSITKKILKENEQCVVLIDEYDRTIVDCIDQKPDFIKKAVKMIHDFYGIFKGLQPKIKKLIFTGIARFAKTSIWSSILHILLNRFK